IDNFLSAPDIFRSSIIVIAEAQLHGNLIGPGDTNLIAAERNDRFDFLSYSRASRVENEAVGIPHLLIRRSGPDHAVVSVTIRSSARIGSPELAGAVLGQRDGARLG